MAEIGQRRKVAVSQLGKYKTILQIVGLSMMLFRLRLLGLPIYRLGVVLTELAAAATLVFHGGVPARGLAGAQTHRRRWSRETRLELATPTLARSCSTN